MKKRQLNETEELLRICWGEKRAKDYMKILNLRNSGMSFRQIAEELGQKGHSTAYNKYNRLIRLFKHVRKMIGNQEKQAKRLND